MLEIRTMRIGAIVIAVVAIALGIVAVLVLRPRELLRHDFGNERVLVLSYSKTHGLIESLIGSGDVTYRFQSAGKETSGTLIEWLDDWTQARPRIVTEDSQSVVIRDPWMPMAWRFTSDGKMTEQKEASNRRMPLRNPR